MNRITAIALCVTLLAIPGMSAKAQPTAALDTKAHEIRRVTYPVIRCTRQDNGSPGLQPCHGRKADEALRIGSNVTRQDFDCVLSGVCGVDDRARVNG